MDSNADIETYAEMVRELRAIELECTGKLLAQHLKMDAFANWVMAGKPGEQAGDAAGSGTAAQRAALQSCNSCSSPKASGGKTVTAVVKEVVNGEALRAIEVWNLVRRQLPEARRTTVNMALFKMCERRELIKTKATGVVRRSTYQKNHNQPLSPSLSPSDGERVPTT